MNIFKKITNKRSDNNKKSEKKGSTNKETAKERLHLVLMQDRANVSADFLELMKQEIIGVIKKYVDIDEAEIDVKLTNKQNSDGTTGAPALYANIPIRAIKDSKKSNKELDKSSEEDTSISEQEILSKEADEEIRLKEEAKKESKPIADNPQAPVTEEKPVKRSKHSLEDDIDVESINDIHRLVESSIEKDELSIKEQAESKANENRKKRTVTAKEISVIKEQQAKKAASKASSRTKKLVDKIQTAKASTQSRLKHAKELSNMDNSSDSSRKITK